MGVYAALVANHGMVAGHIVIGAVLFVALITVPPQGSPLLVQGSTAEFPAHMYEPLSPERLNLYRDDARRMFEHAFDSYMRNAFPHDELKPISGTWTDSLAELGNLNMSQLPDQYNGIALSLIESISTLAVLGNSSEFSKAVRWASENLSFKLDVRVNVFEANIRVVGGLISAHLLAIDESLSLMDDNGEPYDGALLHLATDMATRLLPAFESQTGVPYAWVNLQRGVLPTETTEQNTAGAGTFLLEFGMLSALTGDQRFMVAARSAMRALWRLRSPLGLLGNTLDVVSGKWIHPNSGIGGGSDSFFEYLLKCYVLFGDMECWKIFRGAYRAIQTYVFKNPWYVEVSMSSGKPMYLDAQGLQAFWPAVNVMVGDLPQANATHRAFFGLWQRYGVLPERHSLATDSVHPTERYYLLRPELAEATYYLYRATRDPFYLHAGRAIWEGIERLTRSKHGYASLRDVVTKEKEDRMCSFFLAETCKYLYLLFEDTSKWDRWVFNTEGHLFQLPYETAVSVRRAWHGLGNKSQTVAPTSLMCPNIEQVSKPQTTASSSAATEAEKKTCTESNCKSPCHVPDKNADFKCNDSGDCGIDAHTCIQRVCSKHNWCTTV